MGSEKSSSFHGEVSGGSGHRPGLGQLSGSHSSRSLERCGAPPGVQTGQDRPEWCNFGEEVPWEQGSGEQHPTEYTDNKQIRREVITAKKKLSREPTKILARVVREASLRVTESTMERKLGPDVPVSAGRAFLAEAAPVHGQECARVRGPR